MQEITKTVEAAAARPAGRPDECFYCQRMIGEQHRADCVLFTRRVRVSFTVEMDVEVPAFWDRDMIDFRYCGSSWCANNFTDMLSGYASALEAKGECLCPDFRGLYLGESAPIEPD